MEKLPSKETLCYIIATSKDMDGVKSMYISENSAWALNLLKIKPVLPKSPSMSCDMIGSHLKWERSEFGIFYGYVIFPKVCSLLTESVATYQFLRTLQGLLQNIDGSSFDAAQLLVGSSVPAL